MPVYVSVFVHRNEIAERVETNEKTEKKCK